MKQYLIQQSVDVAITYQVTANSLEEAQALANNGDHIYEDIIDIQVLPWDKPWDVSEVEHWTAVMTQEQLKPYIILGLD
jgi:hypothetical protein